MTRAVAAVVLGLAGLGGRLAGPAAPARAASYEPLTVSAAVEPLTDESFRGFGQLVQVPAGMPPTTESAVERYWGGLARARIHEDVEFGLVAVKTRTHEVAELERHRLSPEILIGLTADFLLVVAPPTAAGATRPSAAKVRIFLVKQGTAVILHKAVWHALPFPKTEEATFLVGWREGTAKKDRVDRPFAGGEVVKF